MRQNMTDTPLPNSIRTMLSAMTQPQEADTAAKMAALTSMLADKRKTFVDGRRLSGIEDVWRKCEDHYAGIDEASGGDATVVRGRWTKSPSLDGPLTRGSMPAVSNRSTAFERMTGRYVDAAFAKIAEVVLSEHAKPFSVSSTPNPDLIKSKADLSQLMHRGLPLERDPRPDELNPPNPVDPLTPVQPNHAQRPADMPGKPLTMKDLADEQVEMVHAKAKKGETIIYDWLLEGKYATHMRKVLHDAPKLGTGILKGPFPELRKTKAVSKTANGIMLQIVEKLKPGVKAISPWDFFPDPDCGESVRDGSGVFERDYLSERQLVLLQEEPGYFAEAITQVIREGPGKKVLAGARDDSHTTTKDTPYEVWYFHGWLTQDEAATINCAMRLSADQHALKLDESRPQVSVVCTLVNDSLIRCSMNALEQSGHVPYHVLPWQRRAGSCFGVGVAEQIFMAQELVNAATRGMINNAGASSGSQIVMTAGLVSPATQGDYAIYGDKLWIMKADASIDDVRKVFGIFTIPNITPQMLTIVMHAYRVAENSSNIPLISQGQSGETTPDTFGATQLQNNNANQLLRSVASTVDESVVEPLIDDLYEWLLLDPDINDDAKGDFQIVAKGSAALMEQSIQDQYLIQEAQFVMNPAFGINPKKWYAALRRSRHLDPKDVQYTEEEQQKLAQVPPQPPPQVQVAQIRAQADLQRAKVDTDRDTAYVQAETQRTQVEREMRMQELALKRELELLKYANERQISLEAVKASLAETAMKLRVQRELSAQDRASEMMVPPTEPAGRAPNGQAFER